MGISDAAVSKHLESLRRRYGVRTRPALVRSAIEAGHVRLDLLRRLRRGEGPRSDTSAGPRQRAGPTASRRLPRSTPD